MSKQVQFDAPFFDAMDDNYVENFYKALPAGHKVLGRPQGMNTRTEADASRRDRDIKAARDYADGFREAKRQQMSISELANEQRKKRIADIVHPSAPRGEAEKARARMIARLEEGQ